MTPKPGTLSVFSLVLMVTAWLGETSQADRAIIQNNCHWDASRPFSENIYCLTRRTKRRADIEVYGHPCTSYTRLVQPERRVGNVIDALTDSALCDRTLRRRWYRFDGPGGGTMPETCVDEYNCGTHSPIWLNGHHPAFYGETIDVPACASLMGDCCARRWYIRVANCGDFFTYLLTDTPGCFMAYCAGSQEPCPAGQSSVTGYSPGCSENFPSLPGTVDLYVGEEGNRVAVYCDYSGAVPVGATIETEWYVQGDHSGRGDEGEFPVYVDSMRGRRRSTLREGHWAGKMGSSIYCKMRARWFNNTGVPSTYIESEKYFAGIKISRRVVEVEETSAAATIQVQSTLPITCLPQFADSCKLILELAHDNEMGGKQCVDGKMQQVVFGDCNVEITPSNWRDVHNVTVKAVRDFYNDGTQNMRVNFKPVYSTVSSELWNDYQVPQVEVVAKNGKNGLCSSTGDPHYNTFDGFYYHVFLEGEFVLYKNKRLPIQINTRLEECGKMVTCNCGVAVKAGDDVIVIDRCMRRKRNLAYGSSFPEGWRSLHRHALEQGDKFVDGLKIYEYEDGRRYTVHLPTGAYLDFRVGEDWVNLYLHASSDDWRSTLGLCGTFDDDMNNDLMHPDQMTVADAQPYDACGESEGICKFAESWRVKKSESFFGPIVEVPVEDHEFYADEQQRYCKCEQTGSGQSTVTCNYHNDVHNCQAEETKKRGVDKTNDVLIKGSMSSRFRRDLRPTVRSDDDDAFDYFEAEFVYNETFKGQVPEWPTPRGITESYARNHCNMVIAQSDNSRVCNSLTGNKLATIIDECMTDIKVTDSLQWAVSSLAAFTEECRAVIHETAMYWEQTSTASRPDEGDGEKYDATQGAQLLSEVCPGGCSEHGSCYEGSCHCHHGFEGDDCSSNVLKQPQIHHVSDDGYCDAAVRPCESIILHGSGYRNVSDLGCHFTDADGDEFTTKARFITFEEVSCRIPMSLTVAGTPRHSALAQYTMYISGDGRRTKDRDVVVYDSRCYSCDKSEGLQSCQRQTESCIVSAVCYGPGDKDPADCCQRCDPSVSQDSFTTVTATKKLILYPRQTSHSTYADSAWKLKFRAFGGSGCPVTYSATESDDLLVDYSRGTRDLSTQLLSAPIGKHVINITVADPCGGSMSRAYNLEVQSNPSPTLERNCADNTSPYFTEASQSFILIPGETLDTQITANDDDDTDLEYYVIKNTNSYVSISKAGMFRYHAEENRPSDQLRVLALDPCKNTAQVTISIQIRECPCGNGGTCVPRAGSHDGAGLYDCKCPEGFTGERCYNSVT